MRDIYNREKKLSHWIENVNRDLDRSDRTDVLKFIEYMKDNANAILWIVRCITALISIRNFMRKSYRDANKEDIRALLDIIENQRNYKPAMSTSVVFATAEEPDPNTVGKVTKQANEDYRDAGNPSGGGEHASDPTGDGPSETGCLTTGDENGRCGLALNRGKGNTEGSPQDTIEFVCTLDPEAEGCSALEDDDD
jgi:hypothetical protein